MIRSSESCMGREAMAMGLTPVVRTRMCLMMPSELMLLRIETLQYMLACVMYAQDEPAWKELSRIELSVVAQGRPGQGSDHNTSKHPELDGMPRCCRIATHGTSGLLQTHAPVLARCLCYRYDLCLARFVARLELELDRIQTQCRLRAR